MDKMADPKVSFIQRLHCIGRDVYAQKDTSIGRDDPSCNITLKDLIIETQLYFHAI